MAEKPVPSARSKLWARICEPSIRYNPWRRVCASTVWAVWVEQERKLAMAWRVLSAADRAHWQAAARLDRARYNAEAAQYRPWLMSGDNKLDLMLGCRRLSTFVRAGRRRPEHPWVRNVLQNWRICCR
jgi:hypothetical protein